MRLDSTLPRDRRWGVDEAAERHRPGAIPADASLVADHTIEYGGDLCNVPDWAVQEQSVSRIGEPLTQPKFEQRLGQVSDFRLKRRPRHRRRSLPSRLQ